MNAHMQALAGAQAGRIGLTREGVVIAVDPSQHAVRVRIEPEGLETGWIPDAGLAAGGLRIGCPCEAGTQVLVEPMNGDLEYPVIKARLFNVHAQPPVSPQTGNPAQPGELLAVAGQATPPVEDGAAFGDAQDKAAWFHLTASGFFVGAGNATLAVQDGSIVLKVGGAIMKLSASGLEVTGGTISSDTDVLAAGISGKSHVHGGVKAGGDNSAGPH
jgi:phage baseplate assembly protein gpV